MLLLLLMINRTGDRRGRAAHYHRGCVLTRMNSTRRHGGQVKRRNGDNRRKGHA